VSRLWRDRQGWGTSHKRETAVIAMAIREILLLGNPKLYEVCEVVKREGFDVLEHIIQYLHDTLVLKSQKRFHDRTPE
jgi:hypothetical protein